MVDTTNKKSNQDSKVITRIDKKLTRINKRLDNIEKELEYLDKQMEHSRRRPTWTWYFAFGSAILASGLGLSLASYDALGMGIGIVGALVMFLSATFRRRIY